MTDVAIKFVSFNTGFKNADQEKAHYKDLYQNYLWHQEHGIRLLTIYESEWNERRAQVRRIIRNALGRSKGKIMARKCQVVEVGKDIAKAFYERYHIQRGTGAGIHYGLLYKGRLVACMRFNFGNNDRGNFKERVWTLGRYATSITIAGGASKLFTHFLKIHKPPVVKSFSDNRLFDGQMYTKLGFFLEEKVPPDYQVYHPKTGLLPKPHWQRRAIPSRLVQIGSSELFNPQTDFRTEREITYLVHASRLYDCGKKRWIWKSPQ